MNTAYYNVPAVLLIAGIVWGIHWMASPKTAVRGNLLGGLCLLGAILLTLASANLLTLEILWISMAIGAFLGYVLALRVTMLQIPQLVALFNGLGGGASALVALIVLRGGPQAGSTTSFTGGLALVVGGVTFSGSVIAAAKLDRRIAQRPVILAGHTSLSVVLLGVQAGLVMLIVLFPAGAMTALAILTLLVALVFGIVFAIRVGGADMPISISLLNSLSGVAGSLAGFVVRDPLLVAAGGIVGASGLILTEIMCRAANRTLWEVLTGRTSMSSGSQPAPPAPAPEQMPVSGEDVRDRIATVLREASTIVIVPGYGMALAGAQHQVKRLLDLLEGQGKHVRFAVHPLAGRMPGHMHVLLAEVDVPYDKLFDLKDINSDFARTDAVIVVGANDVVNPAANTARDTPIYGMPVLNVHEARHVIVCNQDTAPGYSGVDNPLYSQKHVILFLGDAAVTVGELADRLASGGD